MRYTTSICMYEARYHMPSYQSGGITGALHGIPYGWPQNRSLYGGWESVKTIRREKPGRLGMAYTVPPTITCFVLQIRFR